ncbi:MAG: glycosyltransferase [Mogibacterium sp.]|nr:glycosyltransferase [Mogibacterium sp.]
MKDKLLTISIAAYNIESSLERTLLSLMPDGVPDDRLDLVIVDDGSSDGTAAIAESYAERFPDTVRLIRKTNGGYGSTVNTAIEAAKGKYFKLLDGDDAFDAEGLSGLTGFLEGVDTDLVISPFVYERRTVSGDRIIEKCDRHMDLQTVPVCMEQAQLSDGLMMFELCVRTAVLKRSGVRLTEKCFYTDNEYVMAAELYASDAVRYPVPVYRYSLGEEGQSMSIEGRRAHYDDKIRAAYGVFDIYESYISKFGDIQGARRFLADKTISTMVREVYVSTMIMDDPRSKRAELKTFDEDLRQNYPGIYAISSQSRLVEKTRSAGQLTYLVIAAKVLHDETRRTGAAGSALVRFAEYVAAACMIVQCRTIYMHLENLGMYVNRGTWLVMMAALAVCILFRRDGKAFPKVDRKTLLIAAALCIYACVFTMVDPVNRLRVIRCFSALILMIILARSKEGRQKTIEILRAFSNIMVVIAAVSLFCWIFGSTLHILPGTGFVNLDWSPTGEFVRRPTFIHIYYETQWTGWVTVPARNSGIFVEAPMAGFCCSMTLLVDYVLTGSYGKPRMWRTILLIVTIITTFSAVNYVFLMVFCAVIFSEDLQHYIKLSGAARAAVLTLSAAAVVIVSVMVYNKIKWGSGSVRFNDFVVGYNAWMQHPFFGGGFESLEYLQRFMPAWRHGYDVGFSNSPMEILAQGGIYLGSLYIYAFISGLVRALRRKERTAVITIVLFAYLFMFTVVPYQYITFFMLLMISSGYFCLEGGLKDAE